MHKIKHRIFEIIQVSDENDLASKVFDLFIIALIILNVILVIADTFTLPENIKSAMQYVDIFTVVIFTAEYLLRIWTADLLYPQYSKSKARIKYIFSFMALIDLFAVLPFYVPLLIPIDLRVLRILRVVRLLRIFKFNRYTSALASVAEVLKKRSSQLISSMLIVLLLMIISSVIMYSVENPAQPEVFTNAFSGLWWAVATFTTVGYGDIYPVTAVGKILSAIIAMLGIGLIAVPTGIISAGFMSEIEHGTEDEETYNQKHYCPYCGRRLD